MEDLEIGSVFSCKKYNRKWILLPELAKRANPSTNEQKYTKNVSLYGSWGGFKGYDPHTADKAERKQGYVDQNLLNPHNYYEVVDLNIAISEKRSLFNQILSRGFSLIKES